MSAEIAGTTNLFEIMRTTRSMRRLKPDPVPNELIRKILEAGVCAPSGGNMQRWRFLVVRDPQIKLTVGAYYKRAWDEQVAPRYRVGEPAPGMSLERFLRASRTLAVVCRRSMDILNAAGAAIMPEAPPIDF